MKKIRQICLLTIWLVLGIATASRAQLREFRVTGRITDQATREALPNAPVALLGKDSVTAAHAVTDSLGRFTLTATQRGSLRLVIAYIGYTQYTRELQVSDTVTSISAGTIAMAPKGINLARIDVEGFRQPITLKEDTIEYNAGSFKTKENAVVEELLKKLPGITVERDGTIKAGGETVSKVLVDGKPFFGNDPKMATRNLPADILEKVQLIDQKSEQAQFTGIPDGQTQKVLNFTVKENKRRGFFGRATAGYGTDNRFSGNANVNAFRKEKQYSFIGSANNTNGTSNPEGGLGNMGGTSGISRNWFGGIQYNNSTSNRLKVNGSYHINDGRTETESNGSRQNIFRKDSSSYVQDMNNGLNSATTHNMNMRLEGEIDSFYSFIITPNVMYSNNDSYSQRFSTTLNNDRDTVNTNRSSAITSSKTPNISTSALLRRKFRKKGRTLSANLTYNYNNSDVTNFNEAYTRFSLNGQSRLDTIDQKVQSENSSRQYNIRLAYTEPVFRNRFLEVNYTYNNGLSSSDRYTWDRSKPGGEYDQLNDSLTNHFNNITEYHQAGLNLRTEKLKYNYTIGFNVQRNMLESRNLTKGETIAQTTTNFSPTAQFAYNFSQNKRLKMTYRGNTAQPSLDQLQPVPDLSNPLLIRLGNPDLKPSFQNMINISYNTFNKENYRSWFLGMTGMANLNKIVNSTTLRQDGVQVTQPVNLNGSYNLNAFSVIGLPLDKSQKAAFNFTTEAGYRKEPSLVNGAKNFANNLTLGQVVNFNYSMQDKYYLGTEARVTFNDASFSASPQNNAKYFNYDLSLDAAVTLPWDVVVNAQTLYTATTGRGEGFDQQFTRINASIAKTFLPRRQGVLRLHVYDLLNQSVSVNRTVADNYIEDTRNMVLRRYFMLSFTWIFNRFGGQNGAPPPPIIR
ncbi:outer membrane beta-barrel protein [Chitinophaga caseinilytica]|uniref:outer membrane beta-barrel protein n=1 Tax=Chitinophaga caseinilytica TaxID=2267521 RepID=UPI003C305C3F